MLCRHVLRICSEKLKKELIHNCERQFDQWKYISFRSMEIHGHTINDQSGDCMCSVLSGMLETDGSSANKICYAGQEASVSVVSESETLWPEWGMLNKYKVHMLPPEELD